jgi:transcriptional regulator with XRE-family HTH domain
MPEYRPSVFVERVAALRKKRGIPSERALCAGAGIGAGAVRMVRVGRSRSLTGENLFKLACTYGVSIDWLLGLTPRRKRA